MIISKMFPLRQNNMIKSWAMINVLHKKFRYYIGLQLILSIIFCLIVLLLSRNLNIAISAFVGSMIVVITNCSYICIAFSKGLVVEPNLALSLHKRAMLTKFVTNLVIFVLVFILYKQCSYLVLFLGYIVAQSSAWLMLLKN